MSEASAQSRGGVARAAKLSPQRRSEIAQKASHARWGQRPKPVSAGDIARVQFAVSALRAALRMLISAGCEKTAAKVRRSITSADSALRYLRSCDDTSRREP